MLRYSETFKVDCFKTVLLVLILLYKASSSLLFVAPITSLQGEGPFPFHLSQSCAIEVQHKFSKDIFARQSSLNEEL